MKTRVGLRAIDGLEPARRRRSPAWPRSPAVAEAGEHGRMAAAARRRRSAGAAAQCAEPDTRLHPLDRRSRAPRDARGVPRACCATSRPKRCISASCPKARRARGPRRADARVCSMRARKRSSITASKCAPSSRSARPSPSSRAICPPGTAQMLVLGITDITQAASAYRSLLAGAAGLAGADRVPPASPVRALQSPRSRHEECRPDASPTSSPVSGSRWGSRRSSCAPSCCCRSRRWCSRPPAWTCRASSTSSRAPRALASYRLSFGASLLAAS